MAGRTRDRQRAERRRVSQQAMLEAQRRAARRRRLLLAGSAILAVAAFALVFALVRSDDGDESVSADRETSTTASATTTTAPASAAGKPCAPVSEPPPPPTPTVPVKVGPPPTALVMEDLRLGRGAVVGADDTVTAHYIGVSCSTGKVFDSSWSRGQAIPFSLNEVIKGWKQGIPGMKVGGLRLLGIPPDLAYGKAGRPPSIAPDETLWFVVDIIDTKPA